MEKENNMKSKEPLSQPLSTRSLVGSEVKTRSLGKRKAKIRKRNETGAKNANERKAL